MTRYIYDGHPVIHQVSPDPRAWLGREHERPQPLVDRGHFEAFDAARRAEAWTSGPWTEQHVELGVAQIAKEAAIATELAPVAVAAAEVTNA